MYPKSQVFLTGFAAILWGMTWPQSAHAYLDPGAGSALIALILGGFTGIMAAFKMWKERAFSSFKKSDQAETSASEPSKDEHV